MRNCIVVLLVCLMCVSVANAATVWVDGAVGNWSDTTKWVGGVLPGLTDEAQINNGTVNVDQDVTVGMLRMAYVAGTNATLNMTAAAGFTGKTLTMTKVTGEVMSVGYLGAATVNQDTGTVTVTNPVGEVRIMRAATNPPSYYNLSGGVMNAPIIRGGFTGTNLGFGVNVTGGTVISGNIYRLGNYTTVYNWAQGGETLAPGGVGSVGTMSIGQSGYEALWITSAGSKLQVDLALASYDTFRGSGNADLTLGMLDIVAGYTPAVSSFFDVIKLDLKDTTKAGTGTFSSITDTLPGYFTAAWMDLDASGKNETLRLTYIPEPATIALLGLGLLAIRRNKK